VTVNNYNRDWIKYYHRPFLEHTQYAHFLFPHPYIMCSACTKSCNHSYYSMYEGVRSVCARDAGTIFIFNHRICNYCLTKITTWLGYIIIVPHQNHKLIPLPQFTVTTRRTNVMSTACTVPL
jgi:hypothetical protein